MLEKDLEQRLGDRLKRTGCLYFKFTSPQNRGVPDRIVICPDGTVWFVELKKPGGKLAALQSVQLTRLARYGQRTARVWNAADCDAFADMVRREHAKPCAAKTAFGFAEPRASDP